MRHNKWVHASISLLSKQISHSYRFAAYFSFIHSFIHFIFNLAFGIPEQAKIFSYCASLFELLCEQQVL
jgi:hypothetical protein